MSKNELSRRSFLKAMASGAAAAIAARAVPLVSGAPARQAVYHEAPMLADLVASGDLPPVEERLPSNPRVITPYEEVGEYGGTWRRAFKGLSDRWGPVKLNEEMVIEWDAPDPDTTGIIANYITEWTQNEDASAYTFTLRDGLRWSDGTPFTTADIQFWYEKIFLREDALMGAYGDFRTGAEGTPMELEVVDELTWTVTFPAPKPLLPLRLANSTNGMTAGPAMAAPRHYLEQYLGDQDTANQDLINAMLEANGLTTWQELWYEAAPGDGRGVVNFWFRNPDLPIINAWGSVNTPLDDPYLMVRNPYYHAVDTEGNQLPYIDRIQHSLFESNETLNLWIAQGLIDMQNRHLSAADYTFFRENEAAGGYRVITWKAASTHAFHPNTSHPDPKKAALFNEAKFREALSISINRDEINELVYNGLLEPRQASPVSGSPEFDPEFETRWTEYDPDRANALLDELGFTERDGEGFRMDADGETISFTVSFSNSGFDSGPDEVQLVVDYWRAIGLKVNQELLERSLYEEHNTTGDTEVGNWFVDRSSVVMANPVRYTGEVADGPWAINYARWLNANVYGQVVTGGQIEPPPDHPIIRIKELWDLIQREPSEENRIAMMTELLGYHKEHPYMIGTVGEDPQPVVVRNNFFNVGADFISDDTLRNVGLLRPVQFFMRPE
jgi:peptide/nickel transport system substrate-binding protein